MCSRKQARLVVQEPPCVDDLMITRCLRKLIYKGIPYSRMQFQIPLKKKQTKTKNRKYPNILGSINGCICIREDQKFPSSTIFLSAYVNSLKGGSAYIIENKMSFRPCNMDSIAHLHYPPSCNKMFMVLINVHKRLERIQITFFLFIVNHA